MGAFMSFAMQNFHRLFFLLETCIKTTIANKPDQSINSIGIDKEYILRTFIMLKKTPAWQRVFH